MCVDIIFNFASLSFDLDKQLKGQICHFVIKMAICPQGQGQISFGHRMCVDIIYNFALLTFDLDSNLKVKFTIL